ncbi:hypothetical protein M011DRAFT_468487 [Sporormia fimetaria CBS 119925]|uniref:Uncharacterized protein n=1 Tax=Sporormia fimetaria CBS 119925 TaxID=1340428 RepID=A0A6A6V6S6_9PLEO|nr:hypothetical protein M011DRAFT_468487 [Sporormia fimetaria CBS 119925]
MKFIAYLAPFLPLLVSLASAESCSYWSDFDKKTHRGYCTTPNACIDAHGFVVDDRCSGGSNNKCCLTYYCDGAGSLTGYCTNTNTRGRNECSRMRGTFRSNRCPGPTNVKCCEGLFG